ncbi:MULTISPECIES: cupin domain-containing protein [Streptomyces]|uniref:Cupin domain protein n=1 Tax=Streptomyces radiopugnans TaxID=403935 RepID=A0A1H9BBR0_9ACTN|nr:cupin domain-containing protein [Streptomyces radiopugnans]SEP86309.1 Cupin domain protein [Streptomyces radiopugnans]
MITPQGGPEPDREKHPAGEVAGLKAQGEWLLAEAGAADSGRKAQTVVKVPGLSVTLMALASGHGLAEHQAPGAATLLCLTGRVTLSTVGREWELGPDDLIAIPAERHRLTADTDALVLLTVRLD